METVIEKKTVALTEELASSYLLYKDIEHERKYSEEHAAKLATKMRARAFQWENVVIASAIIGNKEFKLNGQHTCGARLLCGGAIPNPQVRWNRYRVENQHEAAQIYRAYDNPIANRTWQHLFRVTCANNGMTKLASMKVLALAAAALAFERGGMTAFGRCKLKGEDRISLPIEDKDMVRMLDDLMGSGEVAFAFVRREAVACAMLATIRKDSDAAVRFWQAIRDGENLSRFDARLVLRNWLMRTSAANGRGGTVGDRRKASFVEMYTRCIHGWNAWRDNRTTALKFCRRQNGLPEAM